MPIYEYTCKKCGHVEDQLVKSDESDREPCSSCGSTKLERAKVNETNFALRGAGWAKDGYRSTKPKEGDAPVPGATKLGVTPDGTNVYRAPPDYKTPQLEWDGDKPAGPSEQGKEIAERNKEREANAKAKSKKRRKRKSK